MKDCPNCGKEGDEFDKTKGEYWCDDTACPVITYSYDPEVQHEP